MERAIQCTSCGILTKEKKEECDYCGNPFMIEVCLPQEDDYVYYEDEEMTYNMEE